MKSPPPKLTRVLRYSFILQSRTSSRLSLDLPRSKSPDDL